MDPAESPADGEQASPDVLSVPYRPWFVPVSRGGRLFQLWMVVFFLGTALVVSTDGGGGTVLGLPGSMGWIYLFELCTIAVLALTYYGHWRGWARRADRRIQAVLDEEAAAAGEDGPAAR
jgi:hypothetical protein